MLDTTRSDSLEARLRALRSRMAREGVDGILISQPENRIYFSGFTGSSGWLLVGMDRALLATDSRYFEQVARQVSCCELVRLERSFADALPAMLAEARVRRVAFEADAVTVAAAREWAMATPSVEWEPVTGWGMDFRAVKDETELELVRRAIHVTDEALAAALLRIRPGMTERQFARTVENCLYECGAHGLAFPTIVACGPNAALPHAEPSDAPLVGGAPVLIDMGARVGGYCADMSRTVCLGEPGDPAQFWEIYNTVLAAQDAALAALRPGVKGDIVDRAARDVITTAGFGECFGHGLGHGVGLSVGELPRLSRRFSDTVRAGSLATIEPGIYLPGWGGVRIEDIALATGDGAQRLTQMTKDPLVGLP